MRTPSTSAAQPYTSIGGQAVIEGVLMRSPHYLAIALRKNDQKILIRELPWKGFSDRLPLLKKPFLRGIVVLLESMVNGIDALTYSAQRAEQNTEKTEALSTWAIASSMMVAFLMGMAFFVAAPHYLTALLGKLGLFSQGVESPLFHLIDGFIKVFFLVSYIFLISQMKDIYRVFQYHGAEHKSIATFEKGEELTVENARKHSTLHPRCGTSFIFFLMVVSILMFSLLLPQLSFSLWKEIPILHHTGLIFIKILLMFPVAGISYEWIRLSAKHLDKPFFKFLILPGLLLQKLTTKEPTPEQLEIALASLKRVLYLEKTNQGEVESFHERELEFQSLSEISSVTAHVLEFPE